MLASEFLQKYGIHAKGVRLMRYTPDCDDVPHYKWTLLYWYTVFPSPVEWVLALTVDTGIQATMTPQELAHELGLLVGKAQQGAYTFDEWLERGEDDACALDTRFAHEYWLNCVWLRTQFNQWTSQWTCTHPSLDMAADLRSIGVR